MFKLLGFKSANKFKYDTSEDNNALLPLDSHCEWLIHSDTSISFESDRNHREFHIKNCRIPWLVDPWN